MIICDKKCGAILLIFFIVALRSFAFDGGADGGKDAPSGKTPLQNAVRDKSAESAASDAAVTLTLDQAVDCALATFRSAAGFGNRKYALGGRRQRERGAEFEPRIHRSDTRGESGL